jgi:hypothetical protein
MGLSVNYNDISKENILKALRALLDQPRWVTEMEYFSNVCSTTIFQNTFLSNLHSSKT